jgi:hypothetical protein
MQGFDNSIVFAEGIDLSGNVPPTNQLGTDGYILIGSSTGNPQGALPFSTDSSITFVPGNGSLDICVDFNNASPTTNKGDLIVNDGVSNVRLAVGTDTQVLTADSTAPNGIKWAAGGGGASPLSDYTLSFMLGGM